MIPDPHDPTRVVHPLPCSRCSKGVPYMAKGYWVVFAVVNHQFGSQKNRGRPYPARSLELL